MASNSCTTPPPASSIHTPSTPRFGYEDSYLPYSPRKSTRNQRSKVAKTPPPQSSQILRTSPRSRKASSTSMDTSPSSPPTASKKRAPASSSFSGGRLVSGALSYETAASAATSLGIAAPKEPNITRAQPRNIAVARDYGMLPTPNKTPKKAPTTTAPAISAIARNLFPVRGDDQVMPSPKKNKGRSAYGMSSFSVQEDVAIPIFTDSMDRIPELDMSDDNPFLGGNSHDQLKPATRASKRRKLVVSGEGEQTIEDLEQRDDGLIYVVRGKKMFRKFADFDDDDQETEEAEEEETTATALDQVVTRNLRRPLTRSLIKPRLLFPTAEQTKAREPKLHNTDDEEADTDIEESSICTPLELKDDIVATPKAPRFGPVSPPTTARTTRSKKIDMSVQPNELMTDDEAAPQSPLLRSSRASGKVSPFDSWQRVKKTSVASSSKKRLGEPIIGPESSKRSRA